ncbi:MAG: GNAT family N-acetyltransferase [Candidatus Bathyarchaeota archaeon]
MSSFVIRPASIEDIPVIIEVRLRTLSNKELSGFSVPDANLYWSNEKFKKLWDKENRLKDNSEVFVAEKNGKIVGFIIFNMEISDDNIDNVIVEKEMQGKGIGRSLVEYVEKLAISRGLKIITTDTTENSNGVAWKAYGFWRKMGYQDTKKRLSTNYDFKVIPLVKKLNTINADNPSHVN